MKSSLVFCGPSGVGKSTILKFLFSKYPDTFKFSVSHTTRQPRAGEQDGREYHFVSSGQFESMIEEEKFIEYTKFTSNYYGTSKMAIEQVQKEGKICVLDLDWQGVLSVRRLQLDAKVIFIRPPSLQSLRDRLTSRGSESTESLEARLSKAEEDMVAQEQNTELCDLVLVNDNIDEACRRVENFLFETK